MPVGVPAMTIEMLIMLFVFMLIGMFIVLMSS